MNRKLSSRIQGEYEKRIGKRRKYNETRKNGGWSDLPEELLSLIQAEVWYGDHPKFRAVCRSWRAVSPPLRLTPGYRYYQSPCLLLHGRGRHEFFNPIYNNTYRMEFPEFFQPRAQIYSFNHGWLLVGWPGLREYFFLDPFTDARLNTPALDPKDMHFWKMCFSSSPTCAECLVVGIATALGNLLIGIHKVGEGHWRRFQLPSQLRFRLSDCNPVLHNGRCYCLDNGGSLGVFNPEDVRGSWIVHHQMFPEAFQESICQSFIAKSDEEIVGVFVHNGGRRMVMVFRLNFDKMAWERIFDIGKRVLYISNTDCFSELPKIRGMGDKIFFPKFEGKNGVYYSLARNTYSRFGILGDVKELKDFPSATWILPIFANS